MIRNRFESDMWVFSFPMFLAGIGTIISKIYNIDTFNSTTKFEKCLSLGITWLTIFSASFILLLLSTASVSLYMDKKKGRI